MAKKAEKRGYFSKIHEKLGHGFQGYEFEPAVLNPYKSNSEFRYDTRNMIRITYQDKWHIQAHFHKDNGNVCAILPDLVHMTPEHQQWWADHLIK